MKELRLLHLEKSIPHPDTPKTILSDITFSVSEGEIFCLMGNSGSGKSSLLRIIGGMDRATAGDIDFFGRLMSSFRETDYEKHRRDAVGYIFQALNLLPGLSVKENVILPLTLQGYDSKQIEATYQEIIRYIDLSPFENHSLDVLSGGELQRAAICRALIKSPKILLADEPTGSLDRHNTISFLHTIRELNTKLHTTVILVTHDAFVASFCDRVAFLENGKIQTVLKRSEHPTHFQTKIIETFVETRWDSNGK